MSIIKAIVDSTGDAVLFNADWRIVRENTRKGTGADRHITLEELSKI